MSAKNKKISLHDIAEAAGVSAITVSRALDPRRSAMIFPATLEKITVIAKKMNYSSNLAARRFKKGRTETISVAIPQSVFRTPQCNEFSSNTSILFWQIMEGLIKTAKQLNYDIKIEPFFDPDKPESLLKNFGHPYSDGVIFIGIEDFHDVIPAVSEKGLPCMLLTTEPSNLNNVPEISFDLNPGFSSAVDVLVRNNRKKVALLKPNGADFSRPYRFSIFTQFLQGAGIYSEDLIFAMSDLKELRTFIAEHRNSLPFDAVFCHNDTTASYLINELDNNGIKVPLDVSIIGFDNNPVFKKMNISTISLPRFELGMHAVELLTGNIEKRSEFNDKKLLAASFIGGATC